MSTPLIYRKSNPQANSETIYKNKGLTVDEFDGNLKSIEDEKMDIDDLKKVFDELTNEFKEK